MSTYKEKVLMIGIAAMAAVTWLHVPECEAGDTRVGYMLWSHHFNDRNQSSHRDDDWNEDHKGLIVERRFTDELWAGVMQYENSIDNQSWAAYITRDNYFLDEQYVEAGYMFGLITGYDTNLPAVPFVFPAVTLKYEQFKVRTLAFPFGVATQFMLEF